MSFVLSGLGIFSGIAIGRAVLMNQNILEEVVHKNILPNQVENEISRFENAIETVRKEFLQLQHNSKNNLENLVELSAFLNVHTMFLEDPEISQKPKDIIRRNLCNAEWALIQQMTWLVQQFDSFDDTYFKERKFDIIQVVERIIRQLVNNFTSEHSSDKNKEKSKKEAKKEHKKTKSQDDFNFAEFAEISEIGEIIVAHDLSPVDTITFKEQQKNYCAFVADVGGLTSHTAILARSMEVPAVLGLKNARTLIRANQLLIVDGLRGVVIVNPSPQILDEYLLIKSQLRLRNDYLKKRLKNTKAQTLDGVNINLLANIELAKDAKNAFDEGADGIGLFRSECLFLNHNNDHNLLNEEEQFLAYKFVAETMHNKPVIIRTLDIGADKVIDPLNDKNTSAMGLRGIRLSLKETQIFTTQIRAILRASAFGKIHILLPLLTNPQEIDQALNLIQQQRNFLSDQNIAFDEQIQIGGMIEVPAAALAIGFVLRRLNFVSIGTNDLIQYTLAIDRSDEEVANLYDALHPAVLMLISHAISCANKANIPVSICGELAGDFRMTKLLLGMGLRNFSMQTSQILKMKEKLCKISIAEITPIVKRILKLDEPSKIKEALNKLNEQ